ncbi:MAG: hypothetical protein J0M34_00855 [Alphaproteobacteria bacterium]|nr:hypothetical protein [Alphaproteobacteria bacterium]
MAAYLSGRYWWLGIAAIVVFTLLLFHALNKTVTSPPSSKKPVQIVAPKPITKPAIPTHPVLDLFNPSSASISQAQAISRTRGQLEQLLVISIILHQCGLISDGEKTNISNAAQAYAVRSKLFNDTNLLMHELNASAQKTYELVYANTKCDEPSLEQLKSQTLAWQSNFMAP